MRAFFTLRHHIPLDLDLLFSCSYPASQHESDSTNSLLSDEQSYGRIIDPHCLLKHVDRESVSPSPTDLAIVQHPLPISRQYITGAISAVGGSYAKPTFTYDYTLRE